MGRRAAEADAADPTPLDEHLAQPDPRLAHAVVRSSPVRPVRSQGSDFNARSGNGHRKTLWPHRPTWTMAAVHAAERAAARAAPREPAHHASTSPASPSPSDHVLALQRRAGNQAVATAIVQRDKAPPRPAPRANTGSDKRSVRTVDPDERQGRGAAAARQRHQGDLRGDGIRVRRPAPGVAAPRRGARRQVRPAATGPARVGGHASHAAPGPTGRRRPDRGMEEASGAETVGARRDADLRGPLQPEDGLAHTRHPRPSRGRGPAQARRPRQGRATTGSGTRSSPSSVRAARSSTSTGS
jgi:hypothetical protein